MDTEPTYVMYIFVNTDLKMGKGKIAAQVGHVVSEIVLDLANKKDSILHAWIRCHQTKIVLRATEEQLGHLRSILGSYSITDAGRTQVPAGSTTVVGFRPMLKSSLFGSYKLL